MTDDAPSFVCISYTQKSSKDLCPSHPLKRWPFSAFRRCVVIGVVPIILENERGVERRHDGVLELDLGTGEAGLIGWCNYENCSRRPGSPRAELKIMWSGSRQTLSLNSFILHGCSGKSARGSM